ncbi:MAG: DolP-mannose mannosyltransferase [Haloferacaceae archaeon]
MVADRLQSRVHDGLPLDEGRDAPAADRLRAALARYYWLVAGALAAGGVLAMARPFVGRHGLAPPLPHRDTVILEYVGWFLARGHTLYVDVWEIKPPLAFLPPYLVATVTGTDMYALHVAGMALTGAAVVVTVAVAARVTGRLTGSPTCGLLAGLVFLAVPDFFYAPWLGYKAKALVFALGVVGLDLTLRDRPFAGGLSAGLAVGVWQLGAVFPAVTTAYVLVDGNRPTLKRHVAGGLTALLTVAAALALYADVPGFVAEVLLSPVVLTTDATGVRPGRYFAVFPGWNGVALTAAGVAGILAAARDPPDETPAWPLALGAALVVGVLLVDLDGLWDTAYPLLFVALGVGVLAARASRRTQLLALVVLGAVVGASFAPRESMRPDPVRTTPSDGLPPALDAEREHVYWTHQKVRSCRFFGARTQRSVLQYYPDADRLAAAPCGDLGLYWNATKERLGA